MEKFFKVTEASRLHGDWFNYRTNRKVIRELVEEFKASQGIEASGHYVASNSIYIVPTENDLINFGKSLCKPEDENLQMFRKNSKIGKAWAALMKEKGLKVLHKPPVPIYFPRFSGGRYRSRLFDIDGIVYCSLDPAGDVIPEGFIELKASEFWKLVEVDKPREA